MIDAVFISDLHLHPQMPEIQARFESFLKWAKQSVKTVYILGDFFHAWIGDDDIDEWSFAIAKGLHELKEGGVAVYYLWGNRDFLLGKTFTELAGWEMITEPFVIRLGDEPVLLVHGDNYCTKDIDHQRFRRLTRNKLFPLLFLRLPLKWRKRLVDKVRHDSAMNQSKTTEQMDVVIEAVLKQMKQFKVRTLIHGHTHRCGLSTYEVDGLEYKRYVLSDWDDSPQVLCYDKAKGLYFTRHEDSLEECCDG